MAKTQAQTSPLTDSNIIQDIREQEAISKLLHSKLCEGSLYHFLKVVWPIIEPGNTFVDAWYIQPLCEHLEAVTLFQIPKLLINIPPRMMKSIIISVVWPAWVWLKYPQRRFICASYAQSLSTRDAVKMRLIIQSVLYRELVGMKWFLTDDQNQKMRFDNTKTGFRFSTSIGGMLTGEGGDYLVIDDPHHALEVHSDKMREEVIFWHDNVFSTRANNPKAVGRVLVMQRLHEKDLSGHLLAQGGWEHLVLPMHKSKKLESKTRLGFVDPRKEGELLAPERFGHKEVKDLEKSLGHQANGQLEQNPTPAGGGLFKREWWQSFRVQPRDKIGLFQFVDCAQKPGIDNDYTVVATWLETLSGYYIIDVQRGKFEAPELERFVLQQYYKHRPHEMIIEDKSAGSSLIQTLRKKTVLPIKAYTPIISKELRAIAATPTVEAKNVFLPDNASWVADFVTEHELFPNAEHDDQVDTTSMAVAYFNERVISNPRMTSL